MILRGPRITAEPRRILFIQLRRIGDTLLGTPAIRALHTRFPRAQLDFIAEQPADEVLSGHPHIARLLVAPRHGLRETVEFVRLMRRERYDWTIDFLSNPRSAQFAFLSGAAVRVGLNRFGRRWAYTHRVMEEPRDADLYAVDLRLEILRQLGVPSAGRELEMFADQAAPDATRQAAAALRNLPRPRVAVAVGGANPAKRYPAELCAAVIDQLQRHGCSCLLTSGPGEAIYGEQVQSVLPTRIPQLIDARVPLLAALYRDVDLYLGPDSSPKHVAVACGIPTVTLFGPGNPLNWNDSTSPRQIVLTPDCVDRPRCVESICAQRGCLRRLDPAVVAEAALRLLNK
ncbi:glycosyltransferase family 9 protein [candidate division KSB1 bacterium]|nr:glycosyltransferase family 9 protein [candidate division KSB1 bacterium]